jgi:hypothetical protein
VTTGRRISWLLSDDQLEPLGGLQLTRSLPQVVGPAVVRGGRG